LTGIGDAVCGRFRAEGAGGRASKCTNEPACPIKTRPLSDFINRPLNRSIQNAGLPPSNLTIRRPLPTDISFGKKGSEKRAAFVQMLKDFDMACINHTRSSHDTYADYTAEMISERMLQSKDELSHGIDNSIFLFHDKSQKTVDALPRIIEGLLADKCTAVEAA
jgi:hypothetical protein